MEFSLNLVDDFTMNIGAHTWQVRFVSKMPSECEHEHEHVYGLCDPGSQTIYVDETSAYSMRLSTFLHELMHAIESIYDVDIDHRDLNLVSDVMTQVFMHNFESS